MPYIDWLGKDDVVNHHKNIPYKTISCREEIGDKDSENMIIKGDNLLALKSLLPYYANSVKMIYIDPPYNTGNTSWVYNDNMDSPLIKKWLNDTVNAEDLSRSDKWLCMMYPRLKLLRELLKEDGVIFISIDDAEVSNLRLICDDIFGADNFTTNITWQSRTSKQNDTDISVNHEHILVYSKNRKKKDRRLKETNKREWYSSKEFAFYPKETNTLRYSNPDNDPRGLWKADPFDAPNIRENLTYEIINPNTGIKYLPPKDRHWRTEEESYNELYADNRIVFGKDGKGKPQLKVFYEEKKEYGEIDTTWFEGNSVGTTTEGVKEIINLFGSKLFDTPKPIRLLKKLLQLSTKDNDIILDSFAGSGTTAQAIIEQNKTDGGNRKFILIETLDYAKDITAERVKRVIEGYPFKGKDKTTLFEKKLTTTQILKPSTMEKLSNDVEKIIEDEKENYTKIEKTFKENTLKVEGIKEIKKFKDGLGGGFKYCELSENIFDEFGELNSKLDFNDIAKHIYFVEFKKPICKKNILNPFVGEFNKSYLYFFENRFRLTDMKKIIKKYDDYKQIIVYAKRTTISEEELKINNIVVRYIPYDIKDN